MKGPFPKFQAKLDAFLKTQQIVDGQQVSLTVFHANDCPFMHQKGDCNCEPTFSYKPVPFKPNDVISLHDIRFPPASNN